MSAGLLTAYFNKRRTDMLKNLHWLIAALLLMAVVLVLSACGQEAKFHSVYETGTLNKPAPQDDERRVYICDYEITPDGVTKAYVCREVLDEASEFCGG
jgi:predicted nucleic acid-binding Zn ribbon protein